MPDGTLAVNTWKQVYGNRKPGAGSSMVENGKTGNGVEDRMGGHRKRKWYEDHTGK